MCQAVALKRGESRSGEAMMRDTMLQALACLQLLPDSTAAASEAAFVGAIGRLQEYNIGLSPMQCLQVPLSPLHTCRSICACHIAPSCHICTTSSHLKHVRHCSSTEHIEACA